MSCKELDFLHALVKDKPQIYGSRMMGGGFGGCTINLVQDDGREELIAYCAEKFKNEFKKDLKVYVTSIGSGTNIVTVQDYAKI